MQASFEIVSGVIVGLGLGYFTDLWLHTRPIFMVIFVLLGFVGGLLNCYRRFFKVRQNGK
ncbi:MAG: AtpZ/AtpI family protein [Burkholderiales bacterium]